MPRKKGSKNLKYEQMIKDNKAGLKKGQKCPKDWLVKFFNNRRRPNDQRLQAAIALLPYFERKLPTDIIHDGRIDIIPPFVPSRGLLAEDYEKELEDEEYGR